MEADARLSIYRDAALRAARLKRICAGEMGGSV
jgi:hypothetical protein